MLTGLATLIPEGREANLANQDNLEFPTVAFPIASPTQLHRHAPRRPLHSQEQLWQSRGSIG